MRGHPPVTRSFKSKTDARLWAQQKEASIRRGEALPSNEARKHTVNALIDRYLETVSRRRPEALQKQKQILGWWKRQIGAYYLSNVTPALIAEKRDELLKENISQSKQTRYRSAATANRYLASLSKSFAEAVREWHWTSDNPVQRVSKEPEPTGRTRYLDDTERNALLKACSQSPLKELELVVMLALTTGMRRSEMLGLKWADVDLARGQVMLHKTKNRERRAVALAPAMAHRLSEHQKGRRSGTTFVFSRPDEDRPLDPTYWFEQAVESAGIKDFRFHDLRHSCASYLAMSGATAPEIAAVLGHKTLQMVKRYAHLSDVHTGTVVERMTRKFFGPS